MKVIPENRVVYNKVDICVSLGQYPNLLTNNSPRNEKSNLLVRTKFYWSWTGGPVLIVRTVK